MLRVGTSPACSSTRAFARGALFDPRWLLDFRTSTTSRHFSSPSRHFSSSSSRILLLPRATPACHFPSSVHRTSSIATRIILGMNCHQKNPYQPFDVGLLPSQRHLLGTSSGRHLLNLLGTDIRHFASLTPEVADRQDRLLKGQMALFWAGMWFMAFGAMFAIIPLFKLWCMSTGDSARADRNFTGHKEYDCLDQKDDPVCANRIVKVNFNGTVSHKLDWEFGPQQHAIYVAPGETALAFFKAKNVGTKPTLEEIKHQFPSDTNCSKK
ncbi:unnamed protein product [Amoebophrya sp. A25]|nr:unnamed protein product [Amoebophrya sp. A25]|eukprot:GSA25T00003701001.1